ncbi:MAG: sulfotransferase [Rhodanobacter sp.]
MSGALILDASMQAIPPASRDTRLAEARALFQGNEPAQAEALLATLQAHEPAREEVGSLLAEVQRSRGRFSAAAGTLFSLCRAGGFEAGVSLRSAEFVRQCDRHAVAEQICQGALARGAVLPELLMLAGNVARETGDFATARARYLAALDAGIDLDRHHVLGALATTRRYGDAAHVEIGRFARHFADARFNPRSRASAGFALAKAQNDLADYKAAAGTLRGANAMVRAAWPWDGAAWERFVAAQAREQVATANAAADRDFVPVFIVGLPRTGTTLTATLLARASGARDRGELRTLRYIADQLVAGGHLASSAAVAEAANLYRMLAVQDDAPATWYLDQDPLNFRYLHIVAAMFPQARVIHLRRDRPDTALSLWSQDFAHPSLAFAYDFDDMQSCMGGHDSLWRCWKQNLKLPMFELDYETLVAEPDAILSRLCDFIGAPAAAAVPELDATPVQSASVWQARQPVYKTSVGRWRSYAPFVPELARFAAPA